MFDISNSIATGGEEIKLSIKPGAEALGLTMSSLGRQVRQAFYGEEAQRIQRGKDELKVMVRYPVDERRSIADLENMRIRTDSGDEVPFASVAEVSFGQAYSSIQRQNRKRVVTVSADVDAEEVEPSAIIEEISEQYIPELLGRYPGVSYGLEGASQEELELVRNLTVASIAALFLIYALIAIPLHSYSQPLIIMSVIPFGLIGAVIGHVVMGSAISMFSLFGLIALAGVVVNDSLVMVDFINTARRERRACQAGGHRVRYAAIPRHHPDVIDHRGRPDADHAREERAGTVCDPDGDLAVLRHHLCDGDHAVPDPGALHAADRLRQAHASVE